MCSPHHIVYQLSNTLAAAPRKAPFHESECRRLTPFAYKCSLGSRPHFDLLRLKPFLASLRFQKLTPPQCAARCVHNVDILLLALYFWLFSDLPEKKYILPVVDIFVRQLGLERDDICIGTKDIDGDYSSREVRHISYHLKQVKPCCRSTSINIPIPTKVIMLQLNLSWYVSVSCSSR